MNDNPVFDRFCAEILRNDVVLFMKGTPLFPQDVFSATVAEALSQLGIRFTAVNIQDNDALREAIEDFSNSPIIPTYYYRVC